MDNQKKRWPNLTMYGANLGFVKRDEDELKLTFHLSSRSTFLSYLKSRPLGKSPQDIINGMAAMGFELPNLKPDEAPTRMSDLPRNILSSRPDNKFTLSELKNIFPYLNVTQNIIPLSFEDIYIGTYNEVFGVSSDEQDVNPQPSPAPESDDIKHSPFARKAQVLMNEYTQTLDRLNGRKIVGFIKRLRNTARRTPAGDKLAVMILDNIATRLDLPLDKPLEFYTEEPSALVDEPGRSRSTSRKSKSVKDKIEDTGEKIGGAKKDFFSENSFKTGDINNMSNEELDQFVRKNKIWPLFKYKEMQNEGYEPALAMFLKKIRDYIPVSPEKCGIHITEIKLNKDWSYEFSNCSWNRLNEAGVRMNMAIYTMFVQQIYKQFAHVKTKEELLQAGKDFKANFLCYPLIGEEGSEEDKRLYIDAQENGFNAKGYPQLLSRLLLSKFFNRTYRFLSAFKYYFEQYEKYAESVGWNKLIKPKRQRRIIENMKEIPQRPHLEHVTRTGEDTRNGENVSPDQFIETFDFRGVEFGNWLPQDERQDVLNMAHDALSDLAELFGVEKKAIGLDIDGGGHTIAAAFGSRGRAKAMAHYEPVRKAFNLTRMNGAGSLAHEYGHAFDNILFGKLCGNLNSPKIYMLTDALRNYGVKRVINDTLSKTTGERFGEISQNSSKILVEFLSRFDDLSESLMLTYSNSTNRDNPYHKTDFFYAACVLDQKKSTPYWSSHKELFARAFETWCFDKLEKSDRKSEYLVSGVEGARFNDNNRYTGNPYPQGKERIEINSKFDKVIELYPKVCEVLRECKNETNPQPELNGPTL